MDEACKSRALDSSERGSWLVRWRRPGTIGMPMALLIASRFQDGAAYWQGLGLVMIGCGQLWRLWAAGFLDKDLDLAMGGPYARTRHPLYFGSLVIGLGYALLSGLTWALLIVPLGFALVYVPTMRHEESRLRERFGRAREEYARSVSCFLPMLRVATPEFGCASVVNWQWHRLSQNREWETVCANALGAFAFVVM